MIQIFQTGLYVQTTYKRFLTEIGLSILLKVEWRVSFSSNFIAIASLGREFGKGWCIDQLNKTLNV